MSGESKATINYISFHFEHRGQKDKQVALNMVRSKSQNFGALKNGTVVNERPLSSEFVEMRGECQKPQNKHLHLYYIYNVVFVTQNDNFKKL